MIRKAFDIEVTERRKDGGRIVINTDVLDRDRDRVFPSGARVDNYLANPVVQFAHNYREPWATIGKTNSLTITEHGIEADFELRPAANEHDPQNIVLLLWNGGWIRTASIGFNPTRAEDNEEGGRNYVDWELLEWSLVPVPANQTALRLAVKALDDGMPEGSCTDCNTDEKDVILRPFPNEHACRLRDPGDFEDDSFRRVSREHEGKPYAVIMGKLRGEDEMTEQAYRYPKDDWSVDEARAHCKAHNGQEFTPASNESRGAEFIYDVIQKFSGSPRNPFGTHSSYQFKGGATGYKRAWRLHFSQINGGATTPAAAGPIRGTVRRVAMIAAGMKPPCSLVDAESISARSGPPSPLEGSFPEKPSDYGLSHWKKPETDADREGMRLSCSDLNVIKRAAMAEIKRRIADRDDEGKTVEELATPEELEILTDGWAGQIEFVSDQKADDNEPDNDDIPTGNNDADAELTPEEEAALIEAINQLEHTIEEVLQ